MLRLSHALWLFAPTALLGGCPIYPSSCHADEDCDFNYVCDYPTGHCVAYHEGPTGPERCTTSEDCEPGLVCDKYDRCVPPGSSGGSAGTSGGESGATAAGSAGESGAATAGTRG
jgi:hypothetical protein